jgi:hypothetical protein
MKIKLTVTEVLSRKDFAYARLHGQGKAADVSLQLSLKPAQRDLVRVGQTFTLELKPA